MNACQNCSKTLEAGQLFCRECGARVELTSNRSSASVTKAAQTTIRQAQDIASTTKNKLVSSTKSLKSKSSSLFSRFTGLGPKAVKLVKDQPIRWGGTFVGLLFALIYLISFTAILNSSGPDQEIQKYLTAVNSRDVDRLSDKTLFPSNAGTPIMPAELTAIYSHQSLHATDVNWNWFADDASLRIENSYGDAISQLQLKSTSHWNFGFYSKSWQITTPAPTFRLSGVTLGATQPATFGFLDVLGSSDPSFTKYVGKTFVGFPGQVLVTTDNYGFENSADNELSIGSGPTTTIRASEGGLDFPSDLETEATTRADATASYCASSQCSYLPYFYDSDYSWDTDPAWDTYYDYNYRASSYSSSGCTLTDSTAVSATSGYAQFDCDIYSSRTIEHVVTYYYYADDVSYFYGNTTKTMTLTVNYKFNTATGKYNISSVTN